MNIVQCLSETCFTPSNEICVVSFDILLICSLSTINLHEVLEFVYLQTIYSLHVHYMDSKLDSRFVMNMTFSNWRKYWFDDSYTNIWTNKDSYRVSLQQAKFV
jgi:hypothetical protein